MYLRKYPKPREKPRKLENQHSEIDVDDNDDDDNDNEDNNDDDNDDNDDDEKRLSKS